MKGSILLLLAAVFCFFLEISSARIQGLHPGVPYWKVANSWGQVWGECMQLSHSQPSMSRDMLLKERVATSGLGADKMTAASRREFLPACQLSDQLAVGFSCLSTASKINYNRSQDPVSKVDFHKHLRPIVYTACTNISL